MSQYKGRAPKTRRDLNEAKKRAKAARNKKLSQQSSKPVNNNARSVNVNSRSASGKKAPSGGIDKKKIIIISAIALVLIAIIGMVFYITTQRKPSEEELMAQVKSGVFGNNISIEGVDVSGKTIDESRETLSSTLEQKYRDTKITYKVNGEQYTKDAYEMGLLCDVEDVLIDAILFEKTGTVFERSEKEKILETEGKAYTVNIYAQEDELNKAVKAFLLAHAVEPIEPTMTFNPDGESEEDYFEWTDEVAGFSVDEASYVAKAVKNINEGIYDFGEIDIIPIEPEKTKASMQKNVVKISEYTTFFGTGDLDQDERVGNIRKMGELISGTVLKPGEIFSINETTGERTEDKGWQMAHAIRRGVMVDELGGGVCQVSSTLYNAFLQAELGIVERHNHTILSVYVDRKNRDEFYLQHRAADATIDYPRKDLKVKNTLSDDIYILLTVDNETDDHEGVTAMVFGPKPEHDYKVFIRTIEDETKAPKAGSPEYKVAENGLAPDNTFVPVGSPYGYPKTTDGSYWRTFKYYYPKDTELQYTYESRKVAIDHDIAYGWVGYDGVSSDSGEKYRLEFEDGGYVDSIFPAQNGVYYLNPDDPLSEGMEGSTYDPNKVEVDGSNESTGESSGDSSQETGEQNVETQTPSE